MEPQELWGLEYEFPTVCGLFTVPTKKIEGVEYPFWLVEIFCLFEISML